ncbi:hypothetical protein [Fimbriiglobus ruber]|uniref:Uncharacterized protein n=1 Tax=Fimbriiglobus ruber TaxID=1908690 RepID=A0A225CZZ1_9BACT|nr:hypothetical protein [Fimbriiglobus ruber]OWK34253.1 hypothetical protein FRUB_10224 [Fimbriiglobus ruber]
MPIDPEELSRGLAEMGQNLQREMSDARGAKKHTQRALLATDVSGGAVVLATDGQGIALMCHEEGTNAEGWGLVRGRDTPTPGLYLWEGYSRVIGGRPPNDFEYETYWYGTCRPVAPEEIAALYAMMPPPETEIDGPDGPDDTDKNGY